MADSKRFVSLEDEIDLRMRVRKVYEAEGITGIVQILGELSDSIYIISQLAEELIEEEKQK